jgi:hypothetical protein
MDLQHIVRDFRRWAENAATPKTRMVTEEAAIKKLRELISDEEAYHYDRDSDGDRGSAVIDVRGRILFNGVHVGWLKKDAGLTELTGFAGAMQAEYPAWTGDFFAMTEPEAE